MSTPFVSTAGNPEPPGDTAPQDSPVAGPAVIFQPAALRCWLHEPSGAGGERAEQLGIGECFSRQQGDLLGGLDDLLAALTDDDAQSAWRLQPGVTYAGMFRTYDSDGGDGALIIVDLDSGQRLASLHQQPRDFASRDNHSIDAAVQALRSVASTANRIVDQHRHAISAALNAVADDLLQVIEAGDQGLRDAVNLTVNAAAAYLERGWLAADPEATRDRLQQVATSSYDEDLDTILGWIDAGIC